MATSRLAVQVRCWPSTACGGRPSPRALRPWAARFSTGNSRRARGTEYLQLHDPELTDSQRAVREAVGKICGRFDDAYWRRADEEHRFPVEFHQAVAQDGCLDAVAKPSDGLSLFYTDLDRRQVAVSEIAKMGRAAVDSNTLLFDGWRVPRQDLIGAENEGFKMMMHGMNAERILIAAEALGIGFAALRRAARYAGERRVFGRPIGQNQAIQHPLADSWMQLEAARLTVAQAARLYDAGHEQGDYANAAKYLAAEAAFQACERAVMVHGCMGYAREYDVERYLREVLIPRIAPSSREMICNYIAERVLGLPRSY